MYAILDKKREYIEAATSALENELSLPIAKVLFSIEANSLLRDCAELIDKTYAIETELNLLAINITVEEWQAQYDRIEPVLQTLEGVGPRLLSLAQRLEKEGADLPDLPYLREQVTRLMNDRHWPEDYGATAAYQALADETEREYLNGELEEGGWE